MSRRPLSVCVITLDESKNIDACLRSVSFADEIVVLDSGSRDDTAERARAHGATVYVEPFRGFGPQKNRCFALARHRFVLSIDADERVTPELARSIESALETPSPAAAFAFARKNLVAGRFMPRGGPFHNWPDWCVRLIDRERARCHPRAVHESMQVDGAVERIGGTLLHEAYPTYDAMMRAMDRYATLGAVRAFEEAGGAERIRRRRPLRATRLYASARFALTFAHKYLLRGGVLDGAHGFVGSVAAATQSLLKYGKLAELADLARSGAPIDAEIAARLSLPTKK
jgi:glycosyltransferase involved in cell wall biosynthesis